MWRDRRAKTLLCCWKLQLGRSLTAFRELLTCGQRQNCFHRGEETTVLSWRHNKEQELSSATLLNVLHLLHFNKPNPKTLLLESMTLARRPGLAKHNHPQHHHPGPGPGTHLPLSHPAGEKWAGFNSHVLSHHLPKSASHIGSVQASSSQQCSPLRCRDPYSWHCVGLAVHRGALKTVFGGLCQKGKTRKPLIEYYKNMPAHKATKFNVLKCNSI